MRGCKEAVGVRRSACGVRRVARAFMPRTRVMVRSGRSTRTERRADMPPVVAPVRVSHPTTTTTKSSQFHVLHR